jgi:hypothetical protein
VWDLLDRTHEPALKLGVAPGAITSLAVNVAPPAAAPALAALLGTGGGATGGCGGGGGGAWGGPTAGAQAQVVAVGDASGTLRLLQLPRTLRRPLAGEARAVAEWVRREGARVAEVAARLVGCRAGLGVLAGAACRVPVLARLAPRPVWPFLPGSRSPTSGATKPVPSPLPRLACLHTQPSRTAALKAHEALRAREEGGGNAHAPHAQHAAGPPDTDGAGDAGRHTMSMTGAAADAAAPGTLTSAGGGAEGSAACGAAARDAAAVERAAAEYARAAAAFAADLAGAA